MNQQSNGHSETDCTTLNSNVVSKAPHEDRMEWSQVKAMFYMMYRDRFGSGMDSITGVKGIPLYTMIPTLIMIGGILFTLGGMQFTDAHSYFRYLFIVLFIYMITTTVPRLPEDRQRYLELFMVRPISWKSALAANLILMSVSINIAVSCLSLAPFLAGKWRFGTGWFEMVMAWIMLLTGCTCAISLWTVFLAILTAKTGAHRVKKICTSVAALLMFVVAGLYFFTAFSGNKLSIPLGTVTYLRWLPPVWFSDAIFSPNHYDVVFSRIGIVLIVTVSLLVVWKVRVEELYTRLMEAYGGMAGDLKSPLASRVFNWIGNAPLVKKSLHVKQVTGVAFLIQTISSREEMLGQKVIAPRLLTLLTFMASFVYPENELIPVLVIVIGLALIPEVLVSLNQTSDPAACWMIKKAPLKGHALLMAVQLVILSTYVPIQLTLGAIVIVIRYGIGIGVVISAACILYCMFVVSVTLALTPKLPASQGLASGSLMGRFFIGTFMGLVFIWVIEIIIWLIKQFGLIGIIISSFGLILFGLITGALSYVASRRLSSLECPV